VLKGCDSLISYKVYSTDLEDTKIGDGFFDGWPNPPSKQKHRLILKNSYKSIVAIDEDSKKIIGFVNAICDGVLSAYIPLLEVLPSYQKQGIGSELIRQMLNELKDIYMVDLCCDGELVPFYEKLNMIKSHGMIHRNYEYQSGR
jgi:ribosomal protein S18 acetylase RimI-like enzyme